MPTPKNKTKQLVKKLKNALNRLLVPKQNTPSLILVPARP